MNEEKRDENMQSNETENICPRLNVKDLILSLVVILLCGCILSGAIPAAFISFAMLALFAYVVIAVRNIGAVIQLLLTSVLVSVLTFLPVCGAAVLALMLGAGTLAWLFMVLPKYNWLPVLLSVVAYVLGFLVTSNPVTPLLSLAFVPAAALMAWAHARDLGRTSTVLHAFLGFVIAVLATLCVILWRAYGAINYDVLMRFINELKQLFVTVGTEAGKMLWESIEAMSPQTAVPAESLEKLRELYAQAFSENSLRTLADMIMGLTPALITVPALIVSYLSKVARHLSAEFARTQIAYYSYREQYHSHYIHPASLQRRVQFAHHHYGELIQQLYHLSVLAVTHLLDKCFELVTQLFNRVFLILVEEYFYRIG